MMDRLAKQCAANAGLYDFISAGFSYPDREIITALNEDIVTHVVEENLDSLGNTPQLNKAARQLKAGIEKIIADDGGAGLESDYISLFEHNRHEQPLRMNAHLYIPGQPAPAPVYQRLLQTYARFGLENDVEQPDHLTVQLEFLAYLYSLLHLTLVGERDDDADRLRLAIEAFYEEIRWMEEFAQTLQTRCNHAYYLPLTQLLRAMLARGANTN